MQRLVELAGDGGLAAALPDRELLLPGDLVVVARAAIAEDAALAVERDVLGERNRLLEMQARAVDPARRIPVPEREVLKRALAALVADGAVQRVVDELELQDVRARLHGHRALRAHDHAFGDRRGAGGIGAGGAGREGDKAEVA